MLTSVIDLLGCPQCPATDSLGRRRVTSDLGRDGRQLRCLNGHGFDIAKQGYVNLLTGRAGANADSVSMVAAREKFLATGHYRPIVEALAGALTGARTVLEAGAGTGHYLAESLPRHGRGLACDLSSAAARKAAKQPHVGAVVADTWAGLPVLDAVVDAVLCVFAPRNFAEFARVLAPNGRLVTITPTGDHLAELRAELGLLSVEADKQRRLRHSASEFFELRSERTLRWTFPATDDEVRSLVEMGPNAFHHRKAVAARAGHSAGHPRQVTAEVVLSEFVVRG